MNSTKPTPTFAAVDRSTMVWRLGLLGTLSAALGVTAVLSLGFGRFDVPPSTVVDILLSRIVGIEPYWSRSAELVVLNVRGPRIVAAMLVGAALAVAGAAYQSLFRNPLAAPDILGVSAGAGFGASLGIILGLAQSGVQALAFGFGLLAVFLCFMLGTSISRHSAVMLVLAGIVVAALFNALLSLLKIVADPVDVLPVIMFWLLGGLNRVTASDIPLTLILVSLSIAVVVAIRWDVTVLSGGQDEAQSMGVNVTRIQLALVLAATLMTASAVALAGTVGWVGLIVPHIGRLLAGGSFHRMLPATALIGALFLLAVDNVCRSAESMELPLSIVTALIGAPLFALLLFRERARLA